MNPLFKLPFWLFLLLLVSPGLPGIIGIEKAVFAFEIDVDKVLWSHLSFRAKSIFGKVSTDVHLKALPIEDVAEFLITDAADDALQPSGATLINLTVDSNIYPLFGSDEIYKTKSWVEPIDGGALQRVRMRQGKDKWQKSYRFTKKGVWRLRKKPKDSREENLPLDQWTKIRDHFYSYGDNSTGCSRILEPSTLLYIVSAINFETVQTPLSLCVFNKKQLHLVGVSVAGTRNLKVNYLARQSDNKSRVDRKIDTIRISFQPRPLSPADREPEDFSFLGLKGSFDIFVDKTSGIPVRVSGKISTFGNIDIDLQEVSLIP